MATVSDGTVKVGAEVITPIVQQPEPTAVTPTVSKAVYKTSPMASTEADGSVSIKLECCDNKAHSHDNKALLDAIDQAFVDRVNSDRVISVVNDNIAHTITFGFKDSADYIVDLSALTTDLHISNATMNNDTLVLTDNDGNNITVDLSTFMTPANVVDGAGTTAVVDGNNVHVDIKLDPATDNAMTVTDAGVKVSVPDGANIYNTDGEIISDRNVKINDKSLTFDGGDNVYPTVKIVSSHQQGGSFSVASANGSGDMYAHDNDIGLYNNDNAKTFMSYNINDDTVSIGRVFNGTPQYRAKFRVLSELQDYDGHSGTTGQILTPKVDGTGVEWKDAPFVSESGLDNYLTDIEPLDSNTVDISTARVAGDNHKYSVKADVKVSQDDGNILETKTDGLYANADARVFEITNARFNTLNYNPYASLGDYDYTEFEGRGAVLTPQASNGSPAGFRLEELGGRPPYLVTDNAFNVPQDIEFNQGFDMRFKLRGATLGKEYTVKWYTGFSPYAVDGIIIRPYEIAKYPNTDTILAGDLNDGDTQIKIEIQAQTNPYSTTEYVRLFNKQPSGRQQFSDNGFIFSNYGLSRHTGKISAYQDNNDGTATITLSSPWSHGSYVIGDGITNGKSAGTYIYSRSSSTAIPRADTGELSDWVTVTSGWKDISNYLTQDVAQAKMVAIFGYSIYEDGALVPFDADHGFDIIDITNIKTKWRNK